VSPGCGNRVAADIVATDDIVIDRIAVSRRGVSAKKRARHRTSSNMRC